MSEGCSIAPSPSHIRRQTRRLSAVAIAALLACALTGAAPRLAAAQASCANPVACENALPGSPPSVWDVAKGQGTTISGFADPFSVDVGQSISFFFFKQKTAYEIDIYRMGYYGGNGARL